MSKTTPWHSIKPYEPHVYHDETECHTGNNVEPEHFVLGAGLGRHHCSVCAKIERQRSEMIAALAHRLGQQGRGSTTRRLGEPHPESYTALAPRRLGER